MKTTLDDAIDTLDPSLTTPSGGYSVSATNGHIGVAWGWYSLSPKWRGVWPGASSPLPMNSVRDRKVMVFMSDGVMNAPILRDHTLGDAAEQTEAICDKAKRAGVEIFTIGFELSSITPTSDRESAEDTMEYCATSIDHFFLAEDATELQQAFDDIGALLFLGTAITN